MEQVLKFRVKLLPGEQPSKTVIKKYRDQIDNVLVFLEKNTRETTGYPEIQEEDSLIFMYKVDIN